YPAFPSLRDVASRPILTMPRDQFRHDHRISAGVLQPCPMRDDEDDVLEETHDTVAADRAASQRAALPRRVRPVAGDDARPAGPVREGLQLALSARAAARPRTDRAGTGRLRP